MKIVRLSLISILGLLIPTQVTFGMEITDNGQKTLKPILINEEEIHVKVVSPGIVIGSTVESQKKNGHHKPIIKKRVTFDDIEQLNTLIHYIDQEYKKINKEIATAHQEKLEKRQVIAEFTDIKQKDYADKEKTTEKISLSDLEKQAKNVSFSSFANLNTLKQYREKIQKRIKKLAEFKDTLSLKILFNETDNQKILVNNRNRIDFALKEINKHRAKNHPISPFNIYEVLDWTLEQGVAASFDEIKNRCDELVQAKPEIQPQIRQVTNLVFNPFGKKIYDIFAQRQFGQLYQYRLYRITNLDIQKKQTKILDCKYTLEQLDKHLKNQEISLVAKLMQNTKNETNSIVENEISNALASFTTENINREFRAGILTAKARYKMYGLANYIKSKDLHNNIRLNMNKAAQFAFKSKKHAMKNTSINHYDIESSSYNRLD